MLEPRIATSSRFYRRRHAANLHLQIFAGKAAFGALVIADALLMSYRGNKIIVRACLMSAQDFIVLYREDTARGAPSAIGAPEDRHHRRARAHVWHVDRCAHVSWCYKRTTLQYTHLTHETRIFTVELLMSTSVFAATVAPRYRSIAG